MIPQKMLDLPLQVDAEGVIRIRDTRVTLYTLVKTYQLGETPEDLHEGFPTVSLADIYAVIAYYLAHQAEIDAYLRDIDEEAERKRQHWEAVHQPPTKAELLARLRNQEQRNGD